MRFEYYPNYEIKKTLVYTLASGLKLEENKNSEKTYRLSDYYLLA